MVGLIAGRYQSEALLGAGGMGEVLVALDRATGRRIALKRLLSNSQASSAQFELEYQTLVRLKHPNIVEALDYGVDQGAPFYTMELLEKGTLREAEGLDWKAIAGVLRDVASGLALVHAQGLIHCDVTPRNIGFGDDGAKLIDFGILSTAGAVLEDLVGTPSFIAPETLHGLPLDGRADVFSLGAVAYRLLCDRNAYRPKTPFALIQAWQVRPPAPRELNPEVPKAFSDLVLAMLAQDRVARPRNMGEVISRLSGLLGEPVEAAPAVGWAYLASAEVVGREAELAEIDRAISVVSAGASECLVFEAVSGGGKTRLLREVHVAAQTAGLLVVVSQAGRDSGAYGTFRELAQGLLRQDRDLALQAAGTHAPWVGHAVPEMIEAIPGLGLAPPSGQPDQDRVDVQRALVAWIAAIAQQRPLALLVDDVQRADEASATALALITRVKEAPILLACAFRTDEDVRALAAIEELKRRALRLPLAGLSQDAIRQLTSSLFGKSTALKRVADWISRASGGSPHHAIEVIRHLVDTGALAYVEGAWQVTCAIDALPQPGTLQEALDQRVAALPEHARGLAQVLGLYQSSFDYDAAIAFADFITVPKPGEALEILRTEGFVHRQGPTYSFQHDGLREAVLRGIAPVLEVQLHQAIARVLTDESRRITATDLQIGRHLLKGNDEQRGAAYLERAGRALYQSRSFVESIEPMRLALEVYERTGASAAKQLDLRRSLLMIGIFSSREVTLSMARPSFDYAWRVSGLEWAQSASRVVGPHLALMLSTLGLSLRWLAGRSAAPLDAIAATLVLATAASSAASAVNDFEGSALVVDRLRLFHRFPRLAPKGTYAFTEAMLATMSGSSADAGAWSREAVACLAGDKITPLDPVERACGLGAFRNPQEYVLTSHQDPACLPLLDEDEALGVHMFTFSSRIYRALYHRMRGEEQAALAILAELESLDVELAFPWHWHGLLAWISASAYSLNRDILGLRKCIPELEKLISLGHHFEYHLEMCRAHYYRERAQFELAAKGLEQARQTPFGRFSRLAIQAMEVFAAELALTHGALVDAQAHAQKAIDLFAQGLGHRNEVFRARRVLAMVLAEQGDVPGALASIANTLEEADSIASPSISGMLHEAGAQIAWNAGETAGFQKHLAGVNRWFEPTRNPALLARLEVLLSLGERGDESEDELSWPSLDQTVGTLAQTINTGNSQDRMSRAFALLMEATDATEAYLLVPGRSGVTVGAPVGADDPGELVRSYAEEVLGGVGAGELTQTDDYFLVALTGPDNEVSGLFVALNNGEAFRFPSQELTRRLGQLLVL